MDQNDIERMLNDFSWADEVIRRSQAERSWNVPPGTIRPVMRIEGAAVVLEDHFWGYRPEWAIAKKIPVASNAKRSKLLQGYWAGLLRRGRVIMPANGWYEWTGPKGEKQGWHLHRADGGGLFIAGLASFGAPGPEQATTGFALVTDDAQGGMLDIHDRRPVVFTAEDAATWLDPATPHELAEQLARAAALPTEAFTWHKVGKAVNNSRNDGPEMAVPLEE